MGPRGVLACAPVLSALLVLPARLPSQPLTPCRPRVSIEKIAEDRVANSTDVQYTFALRVSSADEQCTRVTPTVAFTSVRPPSAGEAKEVSEDFTTEAPPIVTRGGVGTGRVVEQSPVKIVRARIASVACGPCEPGDEVAPSRTEGRGPVLFVGAAALGTGAFVALRKATADSFPGDWLGQLRMSNVRTFGVGCELVASVMYNLGLVISRDGETLSGRCSVSPVMVVPSQCAFGVPAQGESMLGSLNGNDFNVTCGNPASRAGVLSGATLTGTRMGDRMTGTARTPLGETGDWELAKH